MNATLIIFCFLEEEYRIYLLRIVVINSFPLQSMIAKKQSDSEIPYWEGNPSN